MDVEPEPAPAVAEEAGEQVEPMDATPSPQHQTTPPCKVASKAVSMVTEDGARKEGCVEDNDDDVVLVEAKALQASSANLSQDTPNTDSLEPSAAVATADMCTEVMPSKTASPPISSTMAATPSNPLTAAAEPIVIDDEEESEQKDASSSSPAPPGSSSANHSPGYLSSTEPDSEIRIASVTTLGQKGNATVSTESTPPHPVDVQDMNLMITSVTSLQGGAAAVIVAGEGQAEENGLQISNAFSLNPDTASSRPTASFNPGRGSGSMGQLVQNGDSGTHSRADSWISQSASVPRNQKQPGVDCPSPATSLPKPLGQSSSSSSPGSQPQPRTVKVTCANCKKPLKKGQTAYQRKGSTHLFCSTTCLSAFSHKPAPKKSCTMCKKDITNMKGTIVAQVDSSESFQEFCSTGCLGAYENKQNPPKSGLKTKCTVCGKFTEIRHEVSFKTVTHKICSDTCFNVYRRANGLIMNCCEQCGDYLPSRASANHFLLVDGQQKRFCCQNCIRDYKQVHSKLASCSMCKTLIKTGEVLHSLGEGGSMSAYCSVNCMNKGKLASTSFHTTEPTCHFCKRTSLPQYQATLPEGNVLNFCSSQCVTKFQNATLQTSTNGQTTLSTTNDTIQLKCNYCRGAFSVKPETLDWQDKVYHFCSKSCCEDYKKLHCIVTFCEYCQEEKTLHETVKFSGVKKPFCSEGCKLLFKQDFIKRLGLKCVTCNHCSQLCKRSVTRQLGGLTRDFCGEACAKKFHDWYYKAARCDCCKVQGNLTESVMWRSEMKQFCDQQCLLKFYCQQNEPIMVTQKGPENSSLGCEIQGTKLGMVNQGTVSYAGAGLMRDVKNKAVLCKPLTLTKATYCKPHMQSKLLQTDVDDGVKREYVPVPIPVPVFIPMPMNMYSQVTPTPVSMPVPVPVPVFLPTTLQGAEQIIQTISELKTKVPPDPSAADITSASKGSEGDSMSAFKGSEGDSMSGFKGSEGDSTSAFKGSEGDGTSATKGSEGDSPPASKGSEGDSPSASKGSEGDSPSASKGSEGDSPSASKGSEGDSPSASKGSEGDSPSASKGSEGDSPSATKGSEGDSPSATKGSEGDGTSSSKGSEGDGTSSSKGSEGDGTSASKGSEGDGTSASKGSEGDGTSASKGSEGDGTSSSKGSEGDGTSSSKGSEGEGTSASKGSEGDGTSASKGSEGDRMVIAEDQKPDVDEVTVKRECGGEESTNSCSEEEEEDKYEPDLDLEADFSQASDPVPVLEGMDEDMDFILPPLLAEEKMELEELTPRPQPRRQGNKRLAVEEGSDPASSSSYSTGKHLEGRSLPLKARYGVNAWKRWASSPSDQSDDTKVNDSSKPAPAARSKVNLLSLSSEELNVALSRFVREVCRPSGERYAPDSILYLCLGIQQHLNAKGRKDDLFSDPCYQQFGEELDRVLKAWQPSVLPDGSLWGRVEECSLWSSRQLGEQNPAALLRSLVYLNTKYFGLRTVEQHLRLSFANVYGPDTVHPVTKETTVCIRVPSISQDHSVQSRKRKRKMEDGDQDYEQNDSSGGLPVRCLVKKHECHLYELYRSKCPALLRDRCDVFYIQPDPACTPDGPLWFSSAPLERHLLESLLTRVLLVRDVYTDRRPPEEEDEEEEEEGHKQVGGE